MNNKDTKLHLNHVIDSVKKVNSYTENSRDLFFNDQKTYDATIRVLQTMAESITKLEESFKEKYPEIPWKEIRGFRNILVHDYLYGPDKDIIWEVIVKELEVIEKVFTKELNL